MDDKTKKTIAKEWVIFLICWCLGFVGYAVFLISDLINFGKIQEDRLGVVPPISIGIYVLFLIIRSIIWSIKTLKKK
jgi:hypothetical protein